MRSVSSFSAAPNNLPTFLDFQWTPTWFSDSSRILLPFSKIGFYTSLLDTHGTPDWRARWKRRAHEACFGETILTPAETVAAMEDSLPSPGDEDVKDRKGRVVIIAGPTGVGKTRLALALAARLGGEIISADSVQVYRTLDVGSAKTPVHEREGIPHHLIDIVDPYQDYTAGFFFDDARAATGLVLAKGSVPIVVGGTGMYLRWYMNGKVGAPKATKEVFEAVEEEVDRLIGEGGGWDAGLRMLADAGDSTTGPSLARNDWYRLRRALEIIKTSGQPRSAFSILRNDGQDCLIEGSHWDFDFQCYFLYQPRPDLYRKIDQRCEQMIQEGLLEEASSLLDSGLQPNSSSATRSIGYQQAMEFLMECRELDGVTTEERFLIFLEAFQRASRNYVKRQLTWFRNKGQSEQLFNWIDATQPLEAVVETLAKEYERPNEVVSVGLREASAATKKSSYTEEKLLKVYRTKNRIFSGNGEAIKLILDRIRRTQCQRKRVFCVDDPPTKMESPLTTTIL